MKLSETTGHVSANAFEMLGLAGLTSTAELRRMNEHARVQRAMSSGGAAEATSRVVERLLRDPGYRLSEAAAWYYHVATPQQANVEEDLNSHDEALSVWHEIRNDAQGGAFDPDVLKEAIQFTSALFNDPAAWQPLEELTREIADVRVDSRAVYAAAEEAAARWICEALFAITGVDPDDVGDASEIVAGSQGLPQRVLEVVRTRVLERAADQLEQAAAGYEGRAQPLLKELEEDPSLSLVLGAAADELDSAIAPWCELVGVFDEDPYSGREGHALDQVAVLLRHTSIAVVNHASDYSTAGRLLDYARDIAQSASVKSTLADDERRVRYISAFGQTIAALQAGNLELARGHLAEVFAAVSTEEERAEAGQLEILVRARGSGARQQQMVQASSRSGCGTMVGVVVGLLVVAGIVAAIVGSAADSSGESGSNSSDSRADAPPAAESDSPLQSEGQAIDRERTRLKRVESELTNLEADIEALSRSISATEESYPNGAPSYVVNQYEANIRRYNRLVDEFKTKLNKYQADVAAFNRQVDAYNRR